jgi:hypothetical protein
MANKDYDDSTPAEQPDSLDEEKARGGGQDLNDLTEDADELDDDDTEDLDDEGDEEGEGSF